MQADRRVSINASAWQALTTPGLGYFASRPAEPPRDPEAELSLREPYLDAQAEPDTDWRAQVERVLQDWWTEETADARLDLFEAEARALDCARANLADARVPVALHWHDVAGGLPGRYDVVVSNPPFHQSRADDPSLVSRRSAGPARTSYLL